MRAASADQEWGGCDPLVPVCARRKAREEKAQIQTKWVSQTDRQQACISWLLRWLSHGASLL